MDACHVFISPSFCMLDSRRAASLFTDDDGGIASVDTEDDVEDGVSIPMFMSCAG